MLFRLFAGAACAALLGAAAPAFAADSPELPAVALPVSGNASQAIESFYARRAGAPLWLQGGAQSASARDVLAALDRAEIEGFASGPAIASQARALIARAQGGDDAALRAADRLLSAGWVGYVQALQRPTPGMVYADGWVQPRKEGAAQILARAAAAPSLAGYVRATSQVNPLYAQLRDAAWSELQSGGAVDPRVLTSMDRAREMPFQDKYVMVDAASARLYMIQNGRIVDSMKVAVGKPGQATQTPMVASTIYYATVNPYWHVTDELVRTVIARNVLDQGLSYLKTRGYQLMPAAEGDDTLLDPAKVDWHAVAAGNEHVRVRQLPGPANSMGRVKFGFPNQYDIYLHDTPNKELFAQVDRTISHGCIRLEDAVALQRWMLGNDVSTQSLGAEHNVPLPTPVPIYVTYLTAQAHDGQLSFVDDVYDRDGNAMQMAALR